MDTPSDLSHLPHDALMLVLWHLRFDFYPRKRLLSVLCKSARHEAEWAEISRYARWCLNLVKPCKTPWDHSLRRGAWLQMYMSLAGQWQSQGAPDVLQYRTFEWLIRLWDERLAIAI